MGSQRTQVINTWSDQLLSIAQEKASNLQLSEAIRLARAIPRESATYEQANSEIIMWQEEINSYGNHNLQKAISLAKNPTAESLSEAIYLAQQISPSSKVRSQRTQVINIWSDQLLSIAQEKASKSQLSEAIRLARTIPRESTTYSTARDLIKDWRRLMPPPSTSYSETQN